MGVCCEHDNETCGSITGDAEIFLEYASSSRTLLHGVAAKYSKLVFLMQLVSSSMKFIFGMSGFRKCCIEVLRSECFNIQKVLSLNICVIFGIYYPGF